MNPSSDPTAPLFPSPTHRRPNANSGSGSSSGAPAPSHLPRFDSAPGSFLAETRGFAAAAGHRFFGAEPPAEPSCKPSGAGAAASPPHLELYGSKDCAAAGPGLHLSYGGGADDGGNSLLRQCSWTAGMTSHLAAADNVSRDNGSYSRAGPDDGSSMASRRMKSQMNFSNRGTIYQISEHGIPDMRGSVSHSNNLDEGSVKVGQSYNSSNFSIGSWDNANSIIFSAQPSKQVQDNNGDIITISGLDPQMPLEMSTMEKYLQTHNDQVPFKVRAKRGCATHPRSIAERERRTKISEKLRKLQELVPNMDKQTNTSDMLDLAVQHIKGLQTQLEILNKEREECTCSKHSR